MKCATLLLLGQQKGKFLPDKFKKLPLDANVIIDYQNTSMTPLILLNRYVGKVHVLPDIISEVRGLAIADCERYGFVIVEAAPEQKITAELEKSMKLSFQDHLCRLVAASSNFVCITNDKELLKECEKDGVATLRGLKLMELIVSKGGMLGHEAVAIAKQIQKTNPHITHKVVATFKKNISAITG